MQRDLSALKERLTRTSAEQTLLRSIQELETELSETHGNARRAELSEQISMLRKQLSELEGPDYSDLETENRRLRTEVRSLNEKLSAVCSSSTSSICETASDEVSQLRLRLKLCSLLLNKYRETINDLENKTVGQIKSLITSDDLSVAALVNEFKPKDYDFEEHYLQAAKAAYEFVTTEISHVDAGLELNFWLSPKEVISAKVGDDEDLAVLLCSLLYSLGDENAEVVIAELDDLTTHAFVITEHNGKFLLLDPSRRHEFEEFSGLRRDALANYEFKGSQIKRFLYRFNHNRYEQFL